TKKAVQKPERTNPRTTTATSCSINALITRTNNPSVSKVNGRVRITKRGLMTALPKPSNSAATMREEVFAKRMPTKMKLATHSENAVIPNWMRKWIKSSENIQPRWQTGQAVTGETVQGSDHRATCPEDCLGT